MASQLGQVQGIAKVEAVEEEAFLGGGSVPTQQIRTWCVSIELTSESLDNFHRKLRTGTPSVVGRVQRGQLLIDLRSVPPRQDEQITRAIGKQAQTTSSN